jgi:MFS family permease
MHLRKADPSRSIRTSIALNAREHRDHSTERIPLSLDQELSRDAAHISRAMISAYYVAYAVMVLVAGVLLDRYGPRHTIPYRIAVVGIGCLIFSRVSEAEDMAGLCFRRVPLHR